MDGFDLFKKLGAGAKFDFSRFKNDAIKLQVIRDKSGTSRTSSPVENVNTKPKSSDTKSSRKRKREESTGDVECAPLTLLGDMTSQETSQRVVTKHRKQSHKTQPEQCITPKQEEINHFRNVNNIHVYGTDIPEPIREFGDLKKLNVEEDILSNITVLGYQQPTPIQCQALPLMLQKRELLACAPTGSGKTAAYLIPLINQLNRPRKQGFRALIVAPTRELAQQIFRECNRLSEGRGLRIHIIKKVNRDGEQFTAGSWKKFDILITTPNRLVFLLNQEPPALDLKSVEWLIVDEADKLFEAGPRGFREQLATIYRACDSTGVRRAMFSATFSYSVENWCKLNLDNVTTVSIGTRNSAVDTVDQELIYVGDEGGKLLGFRQLIQNGLRPPVLVFVQSKERAVQLFRELIYDGIYVDIINSDKSPQQRENTVRAFRLGEIWVLICTEMMGRGIDFRGVNLVVNYDFPPSVVSYIHRIGRTGRAGRKGRAVTFVTSDDKHHVRSIAQLIANSGGGVPDYMLQMKKLTRNKKQKLSRSTVQRDDISSHKVDDHKAYKLTKRTKFIKKKEYFKKKDNKDAEETKNNGKKSKVVKSNKGTLPKKKVKKPKHKVNAAKKPLSQNFRSKVQARRKEKKKSKGKNK